MFITVHLAVYQGNKASISPSLITYTWPSWNPAVDMEIVCGNTAR